MPLDATTCTWIVDHLRQERDRIIERWTTLTVEGARGRLTTAEVRSTNIEIFNTMVDTLRGGKDVDLAGPEAGELRASLTDLSRSRARLGYSPTETAIMIFALKAAVGDTVDTTDATALAALLRFHPFVDELGLFTFDTFVRARDELIVEQNHQLMELSTPVVKLWDGVMAVPLVGTLDSARAQLVMERLLQTLVDTGSAYAIIDITGVPAVDTQVAQHILKTVAAARLMGAECVISGIRPQIAQTVVSLGIHFGDIVTKASLADALLHTLRRSGIDVVHGASRPEA